MDHAVSYPVLYKKPTPIHKLVWILSHPISKFVSERQTELNEPYIVSTILTSLDQNLSSLDKSRHDLDVIFLKVIGGVGAGNLIATGAAFLANRQEIDSLKTRVAKLETILSNTCSKVRNHKKHRML